ncbi:MAG: hypothetical protein KDE01_01700 [Caldilineaceae bacterium]|nr:hypothetical protein [Caldilineaceae bacterium]MCB9119370.1 hypothetical protein [Caldilineaceae bacterium]HRX02712.1 hypothetical protein [Anaerolineae bacterium]
MSNVQFVVGGRGFTVNNEAEEKKRQAEAEKAAIWKEIEALAQELGGMENLRAALRAVRDGVPVGNTGKLPKVDRSKETPAPRTIRPYKAPEHP